jgi:glycerol-3-phosphate dehydrogenase (NAD(P)+)
MTAPTIAVLGAGSWGTALAILLARNGTPTLLWARDGEQAAAMNAGRCNPRYLPDITFPAALGATADLEQALAAADDVLLAVPSHSFRATLQAIAPYMTQTTRLAWATKGLEQGSRKLLHQVAAEELGQELAPAVISGPTFAREVAAGLPTAVTVASRDAAVARFFAGRLHDTTFRAYTSDDVTGVELGGAIKNVLAIAAGIADGMGMGANTRAALITRGLAEMMRLGVALGGQPETFMGLAGLGDLVLTCTDDQSRNRRLGLALGRGTALEQARQDIRQVVEGVQTAAEVWALASEHGVDMPITEQVWRVLHQQLPVPAAVEALLAREQKEERDAGLGARG